MSVLIRRAIHEWRIFRDVFIGIPFGILSKESIFINAFADVRRSELWSESEFDVELVRHPLIMRKFEAIKSVFSGEDSGMINFNYIGAKKFSFG